MSTQPRSIADDRTDLKRARSALDDLVADLGHLISLDDTGVAIGLKLHSKNINQQLTAARKFVRRARRHDWEYK